MSIREGIGETVKTVREEYGKIELSDKILDLISITGIVLFIVSFIIVFLNKHFNAVNIVFILYPLAVAGLAAAIRMKKRDKPDEAGKLFKEWLWGMGLMTFIALLIIVLSYVFFN